MKETLKEAGMKALAVATRILPDMIILSVVVGLLVHVFLGAMRDLRADFLRTQTEIAIVEAKAREAEAKAMDKLATALEEHARAQMQADVRVQALIEAFERRARG